MLHTVLDVLAKFGGLLSLTLIAVGFVFREYFKAQLTSRFARRLADDKHLKDQKLLLADVSAHLRSRVVEKLVDLRLHHIDQISAQSWSTSTKLSSFVSAKLCAVENPQAFAVSVIESFLEVSKQLDNFSSALASASAFVPEALSTAGQKVYGESLRIARQVQDGTADEKVLDSVWTLEFELSEQIKAAIVSTYDMPEALNILHPESA